MSEFEYPLVRATRLRARWRPSRILVATAWCAALFLLAGTHGGSDGTGRVGARMSVPAAEAAGLGRRELMPVAGPARATVLQPMPIETDGPSSGPAIVETPAAAPPAGGPVVIAAALPAAIGTLLFDATTLVGDTAPQPALDLPGLSLRTSSDAAVPAETPGDTTSNLPSPKAAAPAVSKRPEAAPKLGGTWGVTAAACTKRNPAYYPLVLSSTGARAGGSSCAFRKAQQTGNRWAIAAACRNGTEQWAANVKLVMEGRRLVWSSERGTEIYTRCN